MAASKTKRGRIASTLAHGKIVGIEPIQGSLKFEGMEDGKYENERMVLTSAATYGLEAGKSVADFPKMPDASGTIDWQVEGEPSGSVWIVFRPSTSKLATTVKKAFASCVDNGYGGGVKMRIARFGQSYARNIAYAEAFAGYLRSEGYDVEVGCSHQLREAIDRIGEQMVNCTMTCKGVAPVSRKGVLPRCLILEDDGRNGAAGAIVFPPGTLSNAPLGTLISVLDVNFLTASTGGSQALTDNLIAYLAAPTSIAPLGTPAPSSSILVLTGLGAVGLYTVRRRQRAA